MYTFILFSVYVSGKGVANVIEIVKIKGSNTICPYMYSRKTKNLDEEKMFKTTFKLNKFLFFKLFFLFLLFFHACTFQKKIKEQECK